MHPTLRRLMATHTQAAFLPLAGSRIALGLFFFSSGFNKLFLPASQRLMLDTMIEAGIPAPEIMAVFVAAVEAIVGLLLAIGLVTRLGALPLLAICLVALATVGLSQIPPNLGPLTWFSWLMYLPETPYIFMLLLILTLGAGPLSADAALARRWPINSGPRA